MNKLIAHNLTWQTRKISIKDKTTHKLPNGKIVPTWLNMTRKASKI